MILITQRRQIIWIILTITYKIRQTIQIMQMIQVIYPGKVQIIQVSYRLKMIQIKQITYIVQYRTYRSYRQIVLQILDSVVFHNTLSRRYRLDIEIDMDIQMLDIAFLLILCKVDSTLDIICTACSKMGQDTNILLQQVEDRIYPTWYISSLHLQIYITTIHGTLR